MRCNKARHQIQEWFDTSGVPAMPAGVKEHIRECATCRTLITRWNAIELQIQSMRETTPNLSPDFTCSLQARLRAEAAGIHRPWITRYWHLTLAGASTAALMLFIALRLLTGPHQATPATNLAVTHNPASIQKEAASPTLSSGLPLANH